MSEFVELTANQSLELYKVPKEMVQGQMNSFYSTSNGPDTPYDDGPWPLIVFLHDDNYKDKMIVQFSTIHSEFLGYPEFDPFEDGYINIRGGYLPLVFPNRN